MIRWGVDGNGSGSCPMVGSDSDSVKPFGFYYKEVN
jgi:hypothetical protein